MHTESESCVRKSGGVDVRCHSGKFTSGETDALKYLSTLTVGEFLRDYSPQFHSTASGQGGVFLLYPRLYQENTPGKMGIQEEPKMSVKNEST